MPQPRNLNVIVVLLVLLALLFAPSAINSSAAEDDALGSHIVRAGEGLWCIGRAYRVTPQAIAHANGLSSPFRLAVGQRLTIPAVRWAPVPSGPVCAAQFASPYGSGSTGSAAQPASTTTRSGSTTRHVVQPGETVYCIGRAYQVDPDAILRANRLTSSRRIYPGQGLIIPNVPWTNIPPGPTCRAQAAGGGGFTQLVIVPSATPVCEEGAFFDTLMNICRRNDSPPPSGSSPTPDPGPGPAPQPTNTPMPPQPTVMPTAYPYP